jgi:hypothetical protein
LQVDIDGEIEPAFIDRALLQSAGNIAQGFADIGRSKLDAVFLERIGQQVERRFLHGAFTRIGIRGLVVIGFLVLLRERHAGRHGQQHECDEPADFQDADRRFMGSLSNKSHHTAHVTSMQRAIVGNSPLGTAELNAVIR